LSIGMWTAIWWSITLRQYPARRLRSCSAPGARTSRPGVVQPRLDRLGICTSATSSTRRDESLRSTEHHQRRAASQPRFSFCVVIRVTLGRLARTCLAFTPRKSTTSAAPPHHLRCARALAPEVCRPRSTVEFRYRVHHNLLLFHCHLRKHGKSQNLLTGLLCLRKRTHAMTQIGERRLKMEW
jgi:hypothetical protein